jgi:DNA invertase Pin-like site-specific DNA recombinase
MAQSRTFGYVRGSTDSRVESPEVQKAIIERYCQRIGRHVDTVYVDGADSGKLRLFNREAGRHLSVALRRGDHVVVARLDLLDRSLVGFGILLSQWDNLGIVTHLCDVPGGVLDPSNQYCEVLIKILISFAEYERRMIGRRTGQALNSLKAEGRRYCRFAPMGFQWERRGKKSVIVPDPNEQAICIRVAEMQSAGYSIDQIRQYLAYDWKVRNRNGNEFGNSQISDMAFRGTQFQNAELVPGA